MSGFRKIVAIIAFVLWIAFSFGVYSRMTTIGISEWWQIAIPLCILWLFYVGIVRMLSD